MINELDKEEAEKASLDHHPVSRFLDRMLRFKAEKIGQVQRPPGYEAGGCCKDKPLETFSPGVLFEGVFHGWSGYAKAGRELAYRLANHLYVQLAYVFRPGWSHFPSEVRLSAMERTYVGRNCPWLRFFGPDAKDIPEGRRKIIYTMMETEVVHPDMVDLINRNFHELWSPTRWNVDAFKRSGVSLPTYVVPLGVDATIYRPIKGSKLPECTLLSTHRAGVREVPEGFLFISVGLPSFRKGFDLLLKAFEIAFAGDPDCALVCAVTHSSANNERFTECEGMRSRVYALHGEYDEHRMARIYSACNAYVTASRGEGWNLPLCEAAACGLPVICGDNAAHNEVAGDGAFMFRSEGVGPIPGAERVSPWYKGMPFTVFGKKSLSELVDLLRWVRTDGVEVRRKAAELRLKMISNWNWSHSADLAARRLLELNP